MVEKYNGTAFDEKQFMDWYDCHHQIEHQVDATEFPWYIADIAWSFADESVEKTQGHVPGVVKKFDELC